MTEFQGFPKIARFSREVIVTEKIDGTNGCIFIGDLRDEFLVGSRTQWITPEKDNHGFARWAYEHKDELLAKLGPGRHFGEWWGSGIQRGYGLKNGEKRFSLFNVSRWVLFGSIPAEKQEILPSCVGLVPILWRGNMNDLNTNDILSDLVKNGSKASTGFMEPEGIVIYHIAGNVGFKKTIKKDDQPKSGG